MSDVKPDSAGTLELLEQVESGDPKALQSLLIRHRPMMLAFVEFHLDPRLRARFSDSDVIQEAQLEVTQRMADFLKRRPMPFHLWVRKTAYQRLLNLERDHGKRARRNVDREIFIPDRSSLLLVKPFLDPGPSPSDRLAAREKADLIGKAVAKLADADREILLMRHVEELPYDEIACLLDIEAATARKRYGRALIRLQRLLNDFGLLE